jgi:hypothetical protein
MSVVALIRATAAPTAGAGSLPALTSGIGWPMRLFGPPTTPACALPKTIAKSSAAQRT